MKSASRRGRPTKVPPSDHVLIAAAVEIERRRCKPLRDKGLPLQLSRRLKAMPWRIPYVGGRVGAFRLVSMWLLGGCIGPDSVEGIYKAHRSKVRALKPVALWELVGRLWDKYQPPTPPISLGDRPYENRRHYRRAQRNRISILTT